MEKALEKLQEELEAYRKKGTFNVLVPTLTIQEVSPFHKPVLEIVRINPQKDAGEVYEIVQGSGDFSLRAVALQKIGYAAGLIWNARGCGRTDDGSDHDVIAYRAEAAVRKEDGTYMPMNAEYMVDLRVIEEELRITYERKGKELAREKGWSEKVMKEYVEKNVRRDMLQKRKFRLQLAQTGAMDRVIRKILALKSTYKREELERPFVVPKIAFNPDISDPRVRDILLKQGMDATSMLFGASEKSMIDYQPAPPPEKVVDVGSEGNGVEKGGEEEPEGGSEEKPSEVPFEKMDAKKQVSYLEALMKKKGYFQSKLKKGLDKFTDKERAAFCEHLNKMKDVDELPFE